MRTPTKKPIILIHGIATDGAWEDEVEPLLGVFFRPIKVKYSHYRRLGALKVVAEPWVLLLAILVAACAWIWSAFSFLLLAVAICIGIVAFLSFSVAHRQRLALSTYRKVAGPALMARPHVIAHSFGTFLTAQLLHRDPVAGFGQVILIGSVLSRDFKWVPLINQGRVLAVRNEYSSGDFVAGIAGWAGRVRGLIGSAGKYGFAKEQPRTHEVADWRKACDACDDEKGLVHNVDVSPLMHSESFFNQAHARSLWLPFLWEIDGGEYHSLVGFCQKYDVAHHAKNFAELAKLEAQARQLRWVGADRLSLWEYIGSALANEGLDSSDESVAFALTQFAIKLSWASNECDEPSEERLLCLRPWTALNDAISTVKAQPS